MFLDSERVLSQLKELKVCVKSKIVSTPKVVSIFYSSRRQIMFELKEEGKWVVVRVTDLCISSNIFTDT
jgi:hypothetical protein